MTQLILNKKGITVLKEASFMLPEYTPEGNLMDDIHADLEGKLLETFGACFITPSESIVKDTNKKELIHDDVLLYVVPINDTKLELDKLREIAKMYGRQLNQDFVYFKQPNGEAYFLDI